MKQLTYLFLLLTIIGLASVYALESRVRKVQPSRQIANINAAEVNEEGQPIVVRSGQETSGYDFSVENKRKQVMALVDKAVDYFDKTPSVEKAFNAFSSSPEFIQGDLEVFVYDMEGTCLASGFSQDRIWQNFYEERDSYGSPITQMLIETAKNGGGWVTYDWFGATTVAYVKKISKDNTEYVLGCGFCPFSKEDAVIGLVKAGVAYFNKIMREGKSKTEALGVFGYPLGRFVSGDLYIYAMTFSGDIVAHGERAGLIGTNAWDYRDSNGKYVNREIVQKLKTATGGIWVEYASKHAPKKTYAEKVVDNKGVEYFIACGYYPDADRNAAVDLVRKGYVLMKGHGLDPAAREFNDLDSAYWYGDLYLYVYDLQGKCIADGSNAESVGRNMWDDKDEDGRYYVRELIQKAKDGGGWVDYKVRNSFKSNYVELVDLGIGKYVIGSGLYPTTKLETMMLLARSAADFVRSGKRLKDTIGEFTKPRSRFVRGDLSIFVLTLEGICLAFGTDYNLIWTNLSSWKSSTGIPVIKLLNDTLDRGPGLLAYTKDNLKNVAYVEGVKKDGTTYIVGSKFYQ